MQAAFQQHLKPYSYMIYAAVSTESQIYFLFFFFQSLVKLDL